MQVSQFLYTFRCHIHKIRS